MKISHLATLVAVLGLANYASGIFLTTAALTGAAASLAGGLTAGAALAGGLGGLIGLKLVALKAGAVGGYIGSRLARKKGRHFYTPRVSVFFIININVVYVLHVPREWKEVSICPSQAIVFHSTKYKPVNGATHSRSLIENASFVDVIFPIQQYSTNALWSHMRIERYCVKTTSPLI